MSINKKSNKKEIHFFDKFGSTQTEHRLEKQTQLAMFPVKEHRQNAAQREIGEQRHANGFARGVAPGKKQIDARIA